MRRAMSYLIIGWISFAVSQIPLFLASVDSAYSSFCNTEAWFELQVCLFEPRLAILGGSVLFFASSIVGVIGIELVFWLLRRSR